MAARPLPALRSSGCLTTSPPSGTGEGGALVQAKRAWVAAVVVLGALAAEDLAAVAHPAAGEPGALLPLRVRLAMLANEG